MPINIEKFSAKNILIFRTNMPFLSGTLFLSANQDEKPENFVTDIVNNLPIEWCLIADCTLAVKYMQAADIDNITAYILAEIDDFLQTPYSLENCAVKQNNYQLLETLADVFIRPTLYHDSGDIKIIDYDEKNANLTLQFTGHCSGCPYAQNTLNNVIIRTFNRYLPQQINIKMAEV
ncbi:MAG: NifU family protein [Alphaproteobacteria bacterium]|nr:NifU family protein [Alphaproteobacteria bacterium]